MKEIELNTVYNEDCLETMKKIKDKSVNLIVADFPYFEVKGDFDFIWKDFDEFLKWVEVCAKEFKRILSDNGSLYVYGNSKKIAYKQIIFDKYFNLENSMVWHKKDSIQYQYYSPELARGFNTHNERILFYSNDIDMSKNPFSLYLKDIIKTNNISNRDIAFLFPSKTGGLTGCVSNWINGENVMTKEQYLILQNSFNYFKKDYITLILKYDNFIRQFYNPYKIEEVLNFSQESNITKKYDHPTQKPPKLSRALIETSTRKGDLAYIPFGGSGVEVEQCQILGLDWITGDLEKKYCDMIEDRVKNAKGEVGLFEEKNIQLEMF